jgi:hypothetical protein
MWDSPIPYVDDTLNPTMGCDGCEGSGDAQRVDPASSRKSTAHTWGSQLKASRRHDHPRTSTSAHQRAH